MSKIVLTFNDSHEVRTALRYLALFAREDEAEFWKHDGLDGQSNTKQADAYEHIADVIDGAVTPAVTPDEEFDERLKDAVQEHDQTVAADLGPDVQPEDV